MPFCTLDFKRRFIIISSLITIILTAWIPVVAFLLPPVYDDTFLGEYKYKIERLIKTGSPRIIMIGGSGMAFGVDSSLLERELPGYRVVNLGMYAPIGIKPVMENAGRYLREGDIVIIAPEEYGTAYSLSMDPGYMWQAIDGRPGLILDYDENEVGRLIAAMPRHAFEKAGYIISGEAPLPDGVYARSSFNEYGDVVLDEASKNTMPLGFDATVPIDLEDLGDSEYFRYINKWSKRAKDRGAEVYFMLCPFDREALTGETAAGEFFERLRDSLSVRVMGDPGEAAMEAGWFYDTNFHLNSRGRTYFTKLLTEYIKAELLITEATDIDVPPMPTLQKEKKVLSAETYAGDKKIMQVIIPEDIGMIEDGAFSGCTALREIVMLSKEPSSIVVGEKLLYGTDADIVVPEGSLSTYKTDYRFSRYANKIRTSVSVSK